MSNFSVISWQKKVFNKMMFSLYNHYRICHKWPQICSTFWSFPHSWLVSGFVTRVTWRSSEPPSSPPVFSGVCVVQSLVFCPFFFWPLCCLSYNFTDSDFPFWYLQTLLVLGQHVYLNFYPDSKPPSLCSRLLNAVCLV